MTGTWTGTGTGTYDFVPEVRLQRNDGIDLAARLWRMPAPWLAISSAPLGGGMGLRQWVLNMQVPRSYDGDDPRGDLDALAAEAGLTGPGVGMMTAVDVRSASTVRYEGIYVDATVGVSGPQWAATTDPAPSTPRRLSQPVVGTINVVAALPEQLSDAALVNAVITVTEAKSQALWETGVGGTGTATDAVCVLCPTSGPAHAYGGPRSVWGSRLARAVHRAVLSGCPTVGRG